MTMWKLKGCPRCGGDLFIKKEIDAWEEQCLQCSYSRELKKISRFSQPHPLEMEAEEKEPVHVGRGRRSRRSSPEWNYE